MNWKCPQCGVDDNEASSLRCTCGYEFDEKNCSTLQWIEPPTLNQSSIPHPSGLKPLKTTKVKIGEALYILPIVVLAVALICLMAMDWNPSKKIIAALSSGSFFISTISSLLTDEIGIRGFGAVKRVDNPKSYWTQFVIQCIAVVAFLLIAISVNE